MVNLEVDRVENREVEVMCMEVEKGYEKGVVDLGDKEKSVLSWLGSRDNTLAMDEELDCRPMGRADGYSGEVLTAIKLPTPFIGSLFPTSPPSHPSSLRDGTLQIPMVRKHGRGLCSFA